MFPALDLISFNSSYASSSIETTSEDFGGLFVLLVIAPGSLFVDTGGDRSLLFFLVVGVVVFDIEIPWLIVERAGADVVSMGCGSPFLLLGVLVVVVGGGGVGDPVGIDAADMPSIQSSLVALGVVVGECDDDDKKMLSFPRPAGDDRGGVDVVMSLVVFVALVSSLSPLSLSLSLSPFLSLPSFLPFFLSFLFSSFLPSFLSFFLSFFLSTFLFSTYSI